SLAGSASAGSTLPGLRNPAIERHSLWMMRRSSLHSSIHHRAIAAASNFKIGLRRLAALFPKDVQDVDHVVELGEIDGSKFAVDMNPDFADSRADGRHRLPVAGFHSCLDPVKLMAEYRPCRIRQSPGHLPGVSVPFDSLHAAQYIKIFINGKARSRYA